MLLYLIEDAFGQLTGGEATKSVFISINEPKNNAFTIETAYSRTSDSFIQIDRNIEYRVRCKMKKNTSEHRFPLTCLLNAKDCVILLLQNWEEP
jgi:hypothetical protein